MSALTVLTFPTAEGAQNLSDTLWTANEDGVIEIEDLAVVRRDTEGAPKMWQAVQPDGGRRGLLSGAFWGLAIGTLFVMPLAGAVTGAAASLVGDHTHDFGIDDDFIERVRDQLAPNTSALFVLGSASDLEELRDRLQGFEFDIMSTELDAGREAELREMFTQD